jgi:hypothetical protein
MSHTGFRQKIFLNFNCESDYFFAFIKRGHLIFFRYSSNVCRYLVLHLNVALDKTALKFKSDPRYICTYVDELWVFPEFTHTYGRLKNVRRRREQRLGHTSTWRFLRLEVRMWQETQILPVSGFIICHRSLSSHLKKIPQSLRLDGKMSALLSKTHSDQFLTILVSPQGWSFPLGVKFFPSGEVFP